MPAHDDLPRLDQRHIAPGDPWLPIEILDEVASTNSLLVADPRPWRILAAERQVQGRGRLARGWVTTPGAALAVSVAVPVSGMPLGWVPLVAGLALAEAIMETSGIEAVVKWPNDVLLPGDGERKVAGILSEWTPQGVVVVGSGINVLQTRADLPLDTATSVRAAGGEVTREALLTAYLRGLADHVRGFGAGTRERFVARSATIGREVEVQEPAGVRHGLATGVDAEGRLVLHGRRGEPDAFVVSAGDVVHVRPRGTT